MTARTPPRVATWLLERLGGEIRFAPVIGDLIEQFDAGRSSYWYWWQASGVLALELGRVLRAHALSFSAAILAGFALTQLWELASSHLYQPLYAYLPHLSGHPWSRDSFLSMAGMQLNGLSNCALTFATAWVVIRVHPAHQRSVLVAFVLAFSVPRLPGLCRVLMVAATHSRPSLALVPLIMPLALQAVATLAEGLWLIRAQRFGDMDRWTRIVTVAVAAQAVLVADIYRARLVGALPLSRPEWYALDLMDVAGVAYLAILLWRAAPAAMNRTEAI